MIYSTVGAPNRASEWCETILWKLVGAGGNEPARFVADRFDHMAQEILVAKQSDAVVTSRLVDKAVSDLLVCSKKPFLLTVDTPQASVKSLMVDYGVGFPEAVRRVARSLTAMLPLAKNQCALVLDCSGGLSAHAVAKKLVRHFELDLSQEAIDLALEDVPEQSPGIDGDLLSLVSAQDLADFESRAATASRYGFQTEARTLDDILRAAADPAWALFNGGNVADVAWHPLLLIFGDAPPRPPVAAIDMTGSARYLVYGPYISLPKCSWTCGLLLYAEANAVGASLRLEIYAGGLLSSVDFVISDAGITEVAVSFVSPGPEALIEIRLFKRGEAGEGILAVGGVSLHPEVAKISHVPGLMTTTTVLG